MKKLLFTTAVLELVAGLGLAALPSAIVGLLLGSSLDTPTGLTVGRVTGAALIALGVACWLASRDEQSPAARGLVVAMSFYNIATVMVLATAGLDLGLSGIGLWPGAALHSAMAVWCVMCLRSQRTKEN